GCLAITLAHQVPELQVIAVDISPAALAVARVNAEAHDVASRIQFVESDLFAGLADDSRFPMIVSNPPYVGADDPELDPLVRRYEPHQALIGGQDGGELSKRLIEESASYLSPGGLLLIETSPMLAESLLAHAQSTGQYASCQIRKDLAKLPRILVCRAPA
ncbi:MAG TPA: HemK/PrmC family methyltransferase, partial [Pirellulaceae bacterium]|nr:HemK/PrmC family methyltransferase [Pirellulaceae bacterium]